MNWVEIFNHHQYFSWLLQNHWSDEFNSEFDTNKNDHNEENKEAFGNLNNSIKT